MKSFRNNLYLLGLIWKAAPWRVVIAIAERSFNFSYGAFYTLVFFRLIINALEGGESYSRVLEILLMLTAYGLAQGGIGAWYENIYAPKSDQVILQYLNELVYRQATAIDLACYDSPEFYDSFTKAAAQVSDKSLGFLRNLSQIIGCVFALCLNAGYAAVVDVSITPIAIAPVVCVFIIEKRKGKAQYDYEMARLHHKRRADYVKRTVYLKDYAKELRLSAIFGLLEQKFTAAVEGMSAAAKQYGLRIALLRFLSEAWLQIVMYAVMLGYIAYRYLVHGAFSLGDYSALTGAVFNIAHFLSAIAESGNDLYQSGLYTENLREFLRTRPTILSGEKDAAFEREIALRNVSFSYGGKDILKNVSLTIRKGERIAIAGHNGAGKTTLVKLLMRLYDPCSGSVEVDGVDIRQMSLGRYRALFAAAFQDFQIFSVTAAENVTLDDNYNEETVVAAMRKAGVYDRFAGVGIHARLTREFDENGIILSGGEAQKLAVARVFTSDAPIALLDEPSGALDPVAEHELFERLCAAGEGRTVLFISHRLTAATMADRIYLLEEGEIAEQGSHAELMALNGKYAEMYRLQGESYTMEDDDETA